MTNISRKAFLLVLWTIALFAACQSDIEFESAKWKVRKDDNYPYRAEMLNNLVKNQSLIGTHYSKIEQLLGVPQYQDSSLMSYQVVHDYGRDIDPIYTKYLTLLISKDSIVTSYRIDIWEK